MSDKTADNTKDKDGGGQNISPEIETFVANLVKERYRTRHTRKSLSLEIEMNPNLISNIEKYNVDPRLSTLVKIANALDIPLYKMFK